MQDSLFIGKYKDEVTFDIVDMDSCHILLGRPWEFNLNVVHRGRDNTYTFAFNEVKMMLVPLQKHVPTITKPTPPTKNNLVVFTHRDFEEGIKGNSVIYGAIATVQYKKA